MQNKITGRSNFATKIYNDLKQLLIAIKEHSLNFQVSKYEMSIFANAIFVFLNTRQKDTESLQEYTQRCKSAKDKMESHNGIISKKYF